MAPSRMSGHKSKDFEIIKNNGEMSVSDIDKNGYTWTILPQTLNKEVNNVVMMTENTFQPRCLVAFRTRMYEMI